jgi:site-specific DNA-cytosine methylase
VTDASPDEYVFPSQEGTNVKPLPSPKVGLTVFEFFSGIGGMHLSLPACIKGLPVAKIKAFECSPVANACYQHNFISSDVTSESSRHELKGVLIEGVKLPELDGDNAADIWTM